MDHAKSCCMAATAPRKEAAMEVCRSVQRLRSSAERVRADAAVRWYSALACLDRHDAHFSGRELAQSSGTSPPPCPKEPLDHRPRRRRFRPFSELWACANRPRHLRRRICQNRMALWQIRGISSADSPKPLGDLPETNDAGVRFVHTQ